MGQILIIDRDASGLHALTEALGQEGLDATIVPGGAEGVEWARQHHPEAILLCVELMGTSGYAICNRLKKDPVLCQIPLLLASSEASPEVFDEHRRLKTRADGYVFKPYDIDAVLGALSAALAGGQPSSALSAPPEPERAPAPAPQRAEGAGEAAAEGHGEADREPNADADLVADADPLMSTDALLLLEGSVDVNQHTQVIRMPLAAKGSQPKDLIGAALRDLDVQANEALAALEGRIKALEEGMRSVATALGDQKALVTQLTDALARSEGRQQRLAHALGAAVNRGAQLCLDALGHPDRSS